MHAIRLHAFGGPEQLRFEQLPDPRPARGQVRIRVESAGVHLIDAFTRRGVARGRFPLPELPTTPGREVAGIVDGTGPGVDDGLTGQRVVVDLGTAGGGYAELALAPAESVHLLPAGIEADHAVAMVGTGRTTMAILATATPTADDVAIVTAAAGGIGTLLIQALRAAGATVFGLAAGARKVTLARHLGATHAADYAKPGWPDAVRDALDGRPATLVLDGVGGDIGRAALELLGPGGRLVMFGSASGAPTQLSTDDLFGRGIIAAPAAGTRLLRWPGGLRPLEAAAIQAAVDGRLTPVIGQRFSLRDAGPAHEAIESRATTGKTVLRPGQVRM